MIAITKRKNIEQFTYFQIFIEDQELALVNYILKASDIYFGLLPKEIRRLAFEFARQLNLDMPNSWMKQEMVGKDWFSYFLKRHRNLSIRKPQATSLSFQSSDCQRIFQKCTNHLQPTSLSSTIYLQYGRNRTYHRTESR